MRFHRRWSPRSKLFAVLSVLAGLTAFWLVRGYAVRLEALRPAAGELRPVVVAARALPRGTVLSAEMVGVRELPSAYAPPGALATAAEAEGKTLVSDLAEGEVLTRTRVGVRGGAVAALVPEGLRAFPIRVGMPAGALRPGDHVDVLATFGGPRPYTDTVAEGLEVLSVLGRDDDSVAASGGEGPSLVLLVSPQTAERLAYAVAFGRLSVSIGPAGGTG
ncbi:MAG TPA: Flp pilus assembly protein CpaB [Actinomycetota bacterium]|nr:Flp pilus assembly protein CpaB [Actinomycetota bacterium]